MVSNIYASKIKHRCPGGPSACHRSSKLDRQEIFSDKADYKFIERVCNLVGTSPEGIMERGKERMKIEGPSILCYWATDRLGISHKEMAKRLTGNGGRT
jgi:hypothetical protein